MSLGLHAQNTSTIGEVTIFTRRMSADTLKHFFPLKPGDPFSPESFERAPNILHRMYIFKKLDFETHPQPNHTTDITIHAQDGYYIFPLAFVVGGKF